MLTWEQFEAVDIRVGTVIEAKEFLKARKPAYQLWIDFGELGIKKSSAQITDLYSMENLVGQQILAVVNFPPKQVANFISECLVLGVYSENNNVILIQPHLSALNGSRVV
ncbi:MAG TPA: tRNA-binding protein [Chitinophagales bacterium]|nr:tRNA-binding protein [Chitinophagales bacterium]